MIFKLLEDILTEEKTYKIDYEDINGDEDYLYVIAADNAKFRHRDDIINHLNKMKKNNNTVFNLDKARHIHHILYVHKLEGNQVLDIETNDDYVNKFGNTTFSTARTKSNKLVNTPENRELLGCDNILVHHFDGIENNYDLSNLMGISDTLNPKTVHNFIHLTGFNRSKMRGTTTVKVLIYDKKGHPIVKNLVLECYLK